MSSSDDSSNQPLMKEGDWGDPSKEKRPRVEWSSWPLPELRHPCFHTNPADLIANLLFANAVLRFDWSYRRYLQLYKIPKGEFDREVCSDGFRQILACSPVMAALEDLIGSFNGLTYSCSLEVKIWITSQSIWFMLPEFTAALRPFRATQKLSQEAVMEAVTALRAWLDQIEERIPRSRTMNSVRKGIHRQYPTVPLPTREQELAGLAKTRQLIGEFRKLLDILAEPVAAL